VSTKGFLSQFGLDTLRDLPDIEALEETGLLSKDQALAGEIPAWPAAVTSTSTRAKLRARKRGKNERYQFEIRGGDCSPRGLPEFCCRFSGGGLVRPPERWTGATDCNAVRGWLGDAATPSL
jgi:hypothetical protein